MAKLRNFFVLDFETGGLSSLKNPITEVAVCVLGWDLKDLDEYESLVLPYSDELIYDKQAEMATGISKQLCIEQGKPLTQVVNDLILLAKKFKIGRYKPVLVGHNLEKFDSGFLVQIFDFCNKKAEDYFDVHLEDTLWYAELSRPEKSTHNLQASCSYDNVQIIDAHRALNDTRATRDLYRIFLQKLRGELSSESNQSESQIPTRFRDKFQFS